MHYIDFEYLHCNQITRKQSPRLYRNLTALEIWRRHFDTSAPQCQSIRIGTFSDCHHRVVFEKIIKHLDSGILDEVFESLC